MKKSEKAAGSKQPTAPAVLIGTGLLLAFVGFFGLGLIVNSNRNAAVALIGLALLVVGGGWGLVRIFTGIIGFTVQQGNRYR